jgi:hypothetical protein
MRSVNEIRDDVRAKALWLYGDATALSVRKAWCTDGTLAMVLVRLMQASPRGLFRGVEVERFGGSRLQGARGAGFQGWMSGWVGERDIRASRDDGRGR